MYKIILVGGEIVELDENQYLKFNESYESARTSTDLVQISDMRRIPKKKIDDIVITADVETSEAEKAIRVWYGTTANYNGIRHPFTYWREYLNDTREIEATNKILEMGAYGWGSKILDNYDNYPQELQAKMERPTMLLENLEELCRHFRKEIAKIPDEELLTLTKIESMRENLIKLIEDNIDEMEKAIPEKLVGHKDELQRHYAGGHDDCIEEFLTNLNS